MVWLLTFIPVVMILWLHFRNQRKSEYLVRASNYWIIFYVVGYFLPLPFFFEGTDAWSTIWGYSFSNFEQSLAYAVILATIGGLILSIATAPRRRHPLTQLSRAKGTGAGLALGYRQDYQLKPSHIFIVMAVSFGALWFGIQQVDGLWNLLSNLGDRINLFAGLNAFFLPINMMIGVCFAVSASRVTGENVSAWAEWAAIGVTLPALLLLGQKSNIFILVVGVAIIRAIPRPDFKLRWVLLASFAFANILLIYEFLFREALIIGLDEEKLTLSGWSSYLLTQITGNFMQIQNLTLLVETIPAVYPFSMGDTYVAVLAIPFPESLVGVKPLTTAAAYTLTFWPDRGSTTIPPGLFGEAYLNFGVPGYIVLCLVVGLVLRSVDRPFQSGKALHGMHIVSIATFGSMALHFVRGEFFSPFLIFVGIFIGARAAMATQRQRPVANKFNAPSLSSSETR